MNRYEKVKEHLDRLDIESLRFCTAGGPCACMGCAGTVNGSSVREHELVKYVMGILIPDQQQRSDIRQRQFEALSAYVDPDGFFPQYGFVKRGEVWLLLLHRDPNRESPTIEIQLTGRFKKGITAITIQKP